MSDNTDDKAEIKVENDQTQAELPLVAAEEPVQEEKSAEERLAEMEARFEAEKNARLAAEKRAQEAQMTVYQATNEVDNTNIQLLGSAIDTLKRESEILKANYRAAMSMSDFDKAAEYQEAMSRNAVRLEQLETGKTALETKPRAEPPVQQITDPVEAIASQLSPRSADWLRRHPQFATDQRLLQRMIAAHNLAVTDGYRADTDEYFRAVEETLNIRQKVDRGESALSTASEPVRRRSAPPAAPVSRGGNRAGTFNLSEEQRDAARASGVTEQEYANNLLALRREGKMH